MVVLHVVTICLIVAKLCGVIKLHWLLVVAPSLFPWVIKTVLKAIGMNIDE